MEPYDGLNLYFGDVHNHCAIGYGHGSIEDAFRNARMQLDFACVTVHAHWGDLPSNDPSLKSVVDYHQSGFDQTESQWPHLRNIVETQNDPGKFVAFLGYEWHSLEYGDHCIYFEQPEGEIIRVEHIEDLRTALRVYRLRGIDCMLLPHHIGYRQGYRGINWSTYNEEFSPIVEIMSMHGASESPEAPYPYLHTMGPRDGRSTYQHGLSQGHIVGVMGSTDHHSAHPGSYGHGRLAVWANDLSRKSIWQAIKERRTIALTGDNIAIQFSLNNAPLGTVMPFVSQRTIDVKVDGGSSIDYVDVVCNNRVIHRHNGFETAPELTPEQVKIHLELGWSEKDENVDWEVALQIENGCLRNVEPHFRGHEIVAPQVGEQEEYAFSEWYHQNDRLDFKTRTWGNATTTTASMQGVCLEVAINTSTRIVGTINGKSIDVAINDLMQHPQSIYLGAFLTPACFFNRAIPPSESTCQFTVMYKSDGQQRDWYYVRVRQHNGQWAWSSPIWVEKR